MARLWSVVALAVLVVACAKTRASRVREPDYVGKSFGATAVFAAMADLHQRQMVEEAMVEELGRQGIQAEATVHLFPPTRERTPEERRQILQERSIDSLIAITSEWGTTEHYVPVTGSTTQSTGTIQVSGDQATYRGQSRTQYQGGYYVTKPWAKADFAVIELGTGNLAWLGTSETKGNALASAETVSRSYTKAMVRLMVEDGLFQRSSVTRSVATETDEALPSAGSAGTKMESSPGAGSGVVAPLCVPGQSVACAGSKGCAGYQICDAAGGGFGRCVCD